MYGASPLRRLVTILDAKLKLAKSPAWKNSLDLAIIASALLDASDIHEYEAISPLLIVSAAFLVFLFVENLATSARSFADIAISSACVYSGLPSIIGITLLAMLAGTSIPFAVANSIRSCNLAAVISGANNTSMLNSLSASSVFASAFKLSPRSLKNVINSGSTSSLFALILAFVEDQSSKVFIEEISTGSYSRPGVSNAAVSPPIIERSSTAVPSSNTPVSTWDITDKTSSSEAFFNPSQMLRISLIRSSSVTFPFKRSWAYRTNKAS